MTSPVPTRTADALRAEGEPPPGPLKLSDLTSIGIGQAVGAGLITLIGPAILLTGQSAWLMYVVAVFWGFAMICPIPWITSALRLDGGFYSLVAALGGRRLAGMFALGYLPQAINGSVYGVAAGMYAHALWPALSPVLVGTVFLVIFFVINLLGVSVMAKTQKVLVVIMAIALLTFAVGGLMNVQNPVFDVTMPDFFTDGWNGAFAAVMLFVYSTNGYSCIMNYGRDAADARRDIPRAMFLCVPALVLVYGLIAIVATGVLPIEEVAGQPLTYVAERVLAPSLFVLFMLGGPLLELSTSINSTYTNNWKPIAQSCRDGWLPAWLATENRFGVPWKILTFSFVMAVLPVLLSFSVQVVVSSLMLVVSACAFVQIFAYYQLPRKFPRSWRSARLHVPDPVYYAIVTVSLLAYIGVFVNSLRTLTPTLLIVGLSAIVVCMAYGIVRSRSSRIVIQPSLWGHPEDHLDAATMFGAQDEARTEGTTTDEEVLR